jgi:hypothetical protein
MATLLSTTVATSLSNAGTAVWTAANTTGSGSGVDADLLASYDIRYFGSYNSFNNGVWQRTTGLTVGNIADATQLGRWYPYIIDGARSADGTCGLDLRRTSVHQDGGGFGAFFGTFRYRASGSNFWEVTENWGSGSYYPFVANVQASTTDSQVAIWIRGGLSYSYRFHTAEAFTSTTIADSRSFSGSTVSFLTGSAIPSQSHYYQHNLCAQGYNIGDASFRWGTVYTVTAISASSDARTKENVEMSLGLEFLMTLKPKSYTLRPHLHMAEDIANNLDTRRYHGLVAQDVRDALASLDINYDDFAGLNMTNENHYGLNYDEFIPICVNAVQTQLSQLDELELRVNKLEELM